MSRSDRLDPERIKTNLKTRRIGREIVVYDSTSSTNDVAAEYARSTDNDGLVVFAEQQTAGRYALQWDATNDAGQPLSSGIYFYRIQAGGEFQSVKKMLLLK